MARHISDKGRTMQYKFGQRIHLTDGSTPVLLSAIDGRAYIEHDNPVPFQINGEVQPFLRKQVWVQAPGWKVIRDRDGAQIGIELTDAPTLAKGSSQ